MANGQPKRAFYAAVLLVVLGLVGLAVWRYSSQAPGGSGGQFSSEEMKQMAGSAEKPDNSGITTVKEYNYVPTAKLPEVKGISSYQPMADRTVRFAINVWAGWGPIIYANNGFKPGKLWKTPGGKDFKLELVLIDDPVAMRDAYAAGTSARRLGHARHGAAVPRRAAQRLAGDAAHLPAGRLVERRRRHRGARSHQDDVRSARQDDRPRPELAVAFLRPERPDQCRRAAGGSRVQIHAGCLPGGRRVQRRQEHGRRRHLGAGHLQPRKGQGQPSHRHHGDRQQADRRRVVRARRLRQGQPGHHGRPGARHLRRHAGAEDAGGEAEGRQADGRRLLDSGKRRARHARRRAFDQLRREP